MPLESAALDARAALTARLIDNKDDEDDDDDDGAHPSSLEAAVIRQLSERTPVPTAVTSGLGPSIVDMSALKARSLASPLRASEPASDPHLVPLSLPPDAVVPDTPSMSLPPVNPRLPPAGPSACPPALGTRCRRQFDRHLPRSGSRSGDLVIARERGVPGFQRDVPVAARTGPRGAAELAGSA